MRRAAVGAALLVVVAAGAWWWTHRGDFYTQALMGIGEQVPQSAGERRLAYAAALAQRNPLMGLEGVDPGALAAAVDKLQQLATSLSTEQKTTQDAEAMQYLYPTRFLRAAAGLERARQDFIAAPSWSLNERYDAAFKSAVASYQSDLQNFYTQFERLAADDLIYRVPIGVVSKESQRATLESLRKAATKTSGAFEARQKCVAGEATACEAHDLNLPPLPQSKPVALTEAAVAQANEVRDVLARANARSTYTYAGPLVALPDSSCLGQIPAAPLFVLSLASSTRPETPRFVGTMALIDLSVHTNAYFQDFAKAGIPYAFFELANFYSCPKLLADSSRIMLTLRVAELAGLTSPVQESDALAYIAAHRDTALRLMASERSAALPGFIGRLVEEEQANGARVTKGLPIPRTAQLYFEARNAFYSLFLGDNPSVAGAQAGIASSVSVDASYFPYTYYHDLRKSLSAQEIEKDLARFFVRNER